MGYVRCSRDAWILLVDMRVVCSLVPRPMCRFRLHERTSTLGVYNSRPPLAKYVW